MENTVCSYFWYQDVSTSLEPVISINSDSDSQTVHSVAENSVNEITYIESPIII